jgi:hypothetical protein
LTGELLQKTQDCSSSIHVRSDCPTRGEETGLGHGGRSRGDWPELAAARARNGAPTRRNCRGWARFYTRPWEGGRRAGGRGR